MVPTKERQAKATSASSRMALRPPDLEDGRRTTGTPGSTERLRLQRISAHRTYRRIAPFYDIVDWPFERLRYRAIRPLLFEGLHGRLLDAGAGTGRNIFYYPPAAEVFAVDLSPDMLERAARRRDHSRSAVRLMPMNLTALDFPDDHFDAAIASFVFCTMPPDARLAALRELGRVVRASGCIRLLEYAPARGAFRRALARLWQPWVAWAFGARLDQDIEPELAGAALAVTRSRYVSSTIKLVEAVPSPD